MARAKLFIASSQNSARATTLQITNFKLDFVEASLFISINFEKQKLFDNSVFLNLSIILSFLVFFKNFCKSLGKKKSKKF